MSIELSETALAHFDAPRHVGCLAASDSHVGTGVAGVPGQSDVVQLQLQVNPVQETIVQAVFKAQGSAHLIASAAFVTTWLRDKMLADIHTIDSTLIVSTLALPPTKQYCALLVTEALQKAMLDYQAKIK